MERLSGNFFKFFIQLLREIEFTIQLRERIDSIKSGQSHGTGISCLIAKIIEVVDLHIPESLHNVLRGESEFGIGDFFLQEAEDQQSGITNHEMSNDALFVLMENRTRRKIGFHQTEAVFDFVSLMADGKDLLHIGYSQFCGFGNIKIGGDRVESVISGFFRDQFLIQDILVDCFLS